MTDDNIKEGSGLPEDESSAADRRFDVFENVDYADLAEEKKPDAPDPVDISLDDLLGELDAISAGADAGADESAGKTADFSDLAGATRRDRSKSDVSGSGGFDASFVSPESAPASSGSSYPYTATVTCAAGERVNVRQGAGLGHSHVARLDPGTQVTVLKSINSEWVKVSVNGITGYVMKKFLQ